MKSNIYPHTYYNPTKHELLDSGIENVHIAFDLDSVLNELGRGLGRHIAARLGLTEEEVRGKSPEGAEAFHFEAEGVSHERMSRYVQEYVMDSDMIRHTRSMPEVMKHIYMVTEAPIVVITARPMEAMSVTHHWLDKNLPAGVPFELIMVNGMQKEVVLNRLDIECFVDDRHKTVKRLESCIDVSIRYRRPWNEDREEPAGHFSIEDLRDLIPFVNTMYGHRPMAWPGNVPYPIRMGQGLEVDVYA